MVQVAPPLSAISEKDKHVFSFHNVTTSTSSGAQPVVINEPFQTIYPPPTLKPSHLTRVLLLVRSQLQLLQIQYVIVCYHSNII